MQLVRPAAADDIHAHLLVAVVEGLTVGYALGFNSSRSMPTRRCSRSRNSSLIWRIDDTALAAPWLRPSSLGDRKRVPWN